ncbi:MAG: 6-pyruvoyl-tetrahydropterin synthase related domain [Microgenomates group bacterium Gr01-1014_7]|nr:MAG: 6-pyruvoyl-tetrahydropterin synthase related domain [Microgenomates group bacterium Gr01-1014_7]
MRLEDLHSARLFEMDKCIKDYQIPCRWVPDLGGSYGYPFFNFYAPLPYYFGELTFLLSNNLAFSIRVLFIVSFFGSYLFIYILSRKYVGNLKAILLALIYSFVPYYLLNFYQRGVLGEMWALMFFAATIYSLIRLREDINIRNLLLSGIFIASLLTSSNLSQIIFVPLVLLVAAILFFKIKKSRFLWFSLGSLFLGLLLSSFYLLPKVFESNLIHNGYLPIYAKESPAKQAQSRYELLTGDTKILDFKEGSNWMSFKTEANSHTIIRLSQYYFPNWKVFVDGKQIPVDYKNNSTGLMTFILGKGNHEIDARLYDTPIRSLSNLITLMGIGITTVLFFISFARVRKWILYYRKGIN